MNTRDGDGDSSFTSRGGCFGFEIRSPLDFEYLRESHGGEALLVDERADEGVEPTSGLIYEWAQRPAERLRTALYADGSRYNLWVDTAGLVSVDRAVPRITVPPLGPRARPVWRETIIWGTPVALCFMGRGRLSIHAASIDVGGQGLLLAAPGTFGKTTLAGAFLREGHRVLSDDVSCCDVQNAPRLYPGPALLRLRNDVYERLEFPGTVVGDRTPSKVSLSLRGSQRGSTEPIPLRGIVLLHRSEAAPTITRVEPQLGLRDVLVLTSNVMLDQAAAFEDVTALANSVPIWRLDRRLRYDELPQVVDLVVRTCLKN